MSAAFQIDQMGWEQAHKILEDVFDNVVGNGYPPDILKMLQYLRRIVHQLEDDLLDDESHRLREEYSADFPK